MMMMSIKRDVCAGVLLSVCAFLALHRIWKTHHDTTGFQLSQGNTAGTSQRVVDKEVVTRHLRSHDLRPSDCTMVETGKLGDCETCERIPEPGGLGWHCLRCKASPVVAMDENGADEVRELTHALALVNGTCKPCSDLVDIHPFSDACDECILDTDSNSNLRHRCIAYSTRTACEHFSLADCHRCKDIDQSGGFACTSCAEGMTLLDGKCELRRKVRAGINRILDAGILH
mmetsp:Transcript_7068/g.11386  ORF Transcript_7068/g.11386 Transcript_7068/m.11386 type:complete len:230 (-) Transcript_7068:35-724(-)